jgi:V8-like Glu-specific endopeptidase
MKLDENLLKDSKARMNFNVKESLKQLSNARELQASAVQPVIKLALKMPKKLKISGGSSSLSEKSKDSGRMLKAIIHTNDNRETAIIPDVPPDGPGGDNDFGYERIIFDNDLMMVNYLERGLLAAKAVVRICTRNAHGNFEPYGTGSMILPNLLLTNNHIFPDKNKAKDSYAEFNYQLDCDGVQMKTYCFDLKPDEFFATDKNLDFTVIAVAGKSRDKTTDLSNMGILQIDISKDNYAKGKCLSIIQHPSGDYKSVAIRENQLIDVQDKFIWYQTDTTPGSSGSPVFNDNWKLVALHHSGVPKEDKDGNYIQLNGKPISPKSPDLDFDNIKWEANEGIKITKIIDFLVKKYPNNKYIKEFKKLKNG